MTSLKTAKIMNNRDGPFCTYSKGKLRATIFFCSLIAFRRKKECGENKTKIFVENSQTLIQRFLL